MTRQAKIDSLKQELTDLKLLHLTQQDIEDVSDNYQAHIEYQWFRDETNEQIKDLEKMTDEDYKQLDPDNSLDKSIDIYSIGIISASVCAGNDATIEEITEHLNEEHPTGISSKWQLSQDKVFQDGHPNPCACDTYPDTKKHYLFTC